MATEMLAICDCSFSEIARPAASSLALLMRRPDDSRWTETASWLLLVAKFLCAVRDAMLVLMTRAMFHSSMNFFSGILARFFETAVSSTRERFG